MSVTLIPGMSVSPFAAARSRASLRQFCKRPGARARLRRSTQSGVEVRSVQPEYAADRPDLGRRDQARMRDTHRMQRAFELGLPEFEEPVEFGEARVQIVVLPDVGLEQPGVVGPPVQNVRGGEPVSFELPAEVSAGHGVLLLADTTSLRDSQFHCKPQK